jgi:hypothetical protein
MTTNKALDLALEALDSMRIVDFSVENLIGWNQAITAIKQARLAPVQSKPEYKFCDDGKVILKNPEILSQRYRDTTPPAAQRPWVGLTDDEMYLNCPNWLGHEQCKTWVQQIEAKLKEKNNG